MFQVEKNVTKNAWRGIIIIVRLEFPRQSDAKAAAVFDALPCRHCLLSALVWVIRPLVNPIYFRFLAKSHIKNRKTEEWRRPLTSLWWNLTGQIPRVVRSYSEGKTLRTAAERATDSDASIECDIPIQEDSEILNIKDRKDDAHGLS